MSLNFLRLAVEMLTTSEDQTLLAIYFRDMLLKTYVKTFSGTFIFKRPLAAKKGT